MGKDGENGAATWFHIVCDPDPVCWVTIPASSPLCRGFKMEICQSPES